MYSLVHSEGRVICKAHWKHADFDEETCRSINQMIEKIPRYDNRYTFKSEGYLHHYIVEHQILYFCVARPNMPSRIAFEFLDDLKKNFKRILTGNESSYPLDLKTSVSEQNALGSMIREKLEQFNHPDTDKISAARRQIEDVKQVMLQNIDSVIRRGEHIDTLVDRTSELSAYADNFKVRSRTLQRKIMWQNIKTLGVLVLCVITLCTLLGMMVCDIDFRKCR